MNVITKSVDTLGRWYASVTKVNQPTVSKEDKIVFERSGSIRLNYENEQVKEKINQHIATFSKMEPKVKEA
ncbi:hypothetical protein [Actinobacillus minor]|uniref:Uncharacterized protein n=1 Tax=Actinobacillus minor NM305 TaxID=637911 RepID=C5S5A9_9PAST|nr:hypothetical protein [Actinobacillus minor]EER45895.1 hypothetical protein AM305_03997 [Actinobacillus minor NM305]MDD6911595.1 hypothetical protein [Actinobacillus minor]MDY4713520.1 hypothetical protein [Actinobacillus minor]